jgi:hypothetical protein
VCCSRPQFGLRGSNSHFQGQSLAFYRLNKTRSLLVVGELRICSPETPRARRGSSSSGLPIVLAVGQPELRVGSPPRGHLLAITDGPHPFRTHGGAQGRWLESSRDQHTNCVNHTCDVAVRQGRQWWRLAKISDRMETIRTTGETRTRNLPILNRAPLPLGLRWPGADEWIRTTAGRVLNALPLPVGLRRLDGVAGGILVKRQWPLRPLPLPVGLPRRTGGETRTRNTRV